MGVEERKGAPARVVFADQDAILRELLRALLGCLPHVTVVGEAADGIDAVRLVAQHYPDTVLLDVDMPRLDGFGAAEVIRSFRPQTRLMLHTSAPDDQKRRRADALGLPLLDKLPLNATTDLVEAYAVSDQHPLASDIEPLVLLALAGRATRRPRREGGRVDPVLQPRRRIRPRPAVPARAREPRRSACPRCAGTARGRVADPLEEQPLARALTSRMPVADVVYLRAADGTIQPFTMTSLPFFDPDGELIGVGNYVTAADLAGPRP